MIVKCISDTFNHRAFIFVHKTVILNNVISSLETILSFQAGNLLGLLLILSDVLCFYFPLLLACLGFNSILPAFSFSRNFRIFLRFLIISAPVYVFILYYLSDNTAIIFPRIHFLSPILWGSTATVSFILRQERLLVLLS